MTTRTKRAEGPSRRPDWNKGLVVGLGGRTDGRIEERTWCISGIATCKRTTCGSEVAGIFNLALDGRPDFSEFLDKQS